jgi:pterin-4a-carbinolamine dehydratase
LGSILVDELTGWTETTSPVPEDSSKIRVELFREFRFRSFQSAVGFMNLVAPGCDIVNHHPRWENIWKTVRVYLTTWDIGHRISDRDVQLARYFDRAYSEYTEDGSGRQVDRPKDRPKDRPEGR